MLFIIGIVFVIVLIFVISSSSSEVADAQASAEQESRMASRVAAYRDYIRREGGKSEWVKMTDNELEDMIADAIRRYQDEGDTATGLGRILLWIGFPAIGFAIVWWFGTEALRGQWQTFLVIIGISFAIALFISYVIAAWFGQRTDRKWEAQGWDVDKLIV